MPDLPHGIYPSYEAAGIEIPWNRRSGEVKVFCPWCHKDRAKHPNDKSLRVNLDKGTWHCHHPGCPEPNGGLDRGPDWRNFKAPVVRKKVVPPPALLDEENADLRGWLHGRSIDDETIDRNRLQLGEPDRYPGQKIIGFPFFRGGEHINTQWRRVNPENVTDKETKGFWMEDGADKDFFGIDDVIDAETWIIVEGMMDKLAIEAATGYLNVVSVPNGSNTNLNEILPPLAEKLKAVKRFILAGDQDDPDPKTGKKPGEELMLELARRLGREKCWRVTWAGKDANDTLMRFGPEVVGACLNDAQPFPIEGIFHPRDLIDAVIQLKYQGERLGVPVMANSLGRQLRIGKGMLMLISGIPGSGKSRGADNVIISTGNDHGWRWGVCSPESWPLQLHQKHLIQIMSGESVAGEANLGIPPMSDDDIAYWSMKLDKMVSFVKPESINVKSIIEAIEKEILSQGLDAVLLDPWNRLGHRLTGGMSMTDYVGVTLSELKQLAQRHDIFIGIAAHPAKPERAKDNGDGFIVVKPYDIADSHNFFDMADFVVTWARHKDDLGAGTLVSVGKVKTEEYGREGSVLLSFDPVTSRLSDYTEVPR